jgi:hypothetical protein
MLDKMLVNAVNISRMLQNTSCYNDGLIYKLDSRKRKEAYIRIKCRNCNKVICLSRPRDILRRGFKHLCN